MTIQNILSKEKLKGSLNLKDKLKQLQSSPITEIYLLTRMCSVIRNTDNRFRKEGNIKYFRKQYASRSEVRGKTKDDDKCEGTRSGHFLSRHMLCKEDLNW